MTTPEQNGAKDLMSAYLDQELDEAQAAAVETLLEHDPQAKQELSDLQRVVSLVASLPAVEAPADFVEQVTRKARRQKLVSAQQLALISLPFQVLSILVILAVAALYMMAQLEQEPQGKLERDPAAITTKDPERAGLRPVVP